MDIKLIQADMGEIRLLLEGEQCERFFDGETDESKFKLISVNGTITGFTEITANLGYVFIFVHKRFRRNGIASAVLDECLKNAENAGRKAVITSYPASDENARSFCVSHRFVPEYQSALMEYRGDGFCVDSAPLRQYTDVDYAEAHGLYSNAFHLMRLSTKLFPNSKPEPPSDRQRAEWASTADTRYIFSVKGEIVGYAHVEGSEISSISVKPGMQGNGIGSAFLKALMNMILTEYDSVSLSCVVGNRAVNLYRRTGFAEITRAEYAVLRNN